MTTTPNDAAVNAESAVRHTDAGLIEQLRIMLNQWNRNLLQPLRVLDVALVTEATEWIERRASTNAESAAKLVCCECGETEENCECTCALCGADRHDGCNCEEEFSDDD